jgi:hypothetical protein
MGRGAALWSKDVGLATFVTEVRVLSVYLGFCFGNSRLPITLSGCVTFQE